MSASSEDNSTLRSDQGAHHYRRLWHMMSGHRKRYLAAILSLVVASCFLYLVPLVPQAVIDGVLSENQSNVAPLTTWVVNFLGGRSFLRDHLWLPALIMVALTALAGIFTYFRGSLSASASEGIVRSVRDKLYDHLQHLPCSYHDRNETGDLVQRCTSDVDTLREFLASQVVEIGRAGFMLLLPLPLMLAMDVGMTLISVVLVPIIVLFSFVFFRKVKKVFKEADEAEGKMTSTLQENLTGIRVVRAFARQDHEIEKFAENNQTHRKLNFRMYWIFGWFWSFSDLMCMAQKMLVLGMGAYWVLTNQLSSGSFVFFLLAVNMFVWPIRMMGRVLAEAGKAMVAIGCIVEILDAPREDPEEKEKILSLPQTRPPERKASASISATGHLVFSNVSMSHLPLPKKDKQGGQADKEQEKHQAPISKQESAEAEKISVLENVSFQVAAGQTLALLGASGCGKSTVINLLLRFYDPDSGTLCLDGIDLTERPRKYARSRISAVLQEPFLYAKSIRDNIKLGRVHAEEDEICDAATAASIHQTIEAFNDGYETLVGERGVTLSGGQRQRVALARALLDEPDVLILDDALSAVDTETEAMILKALRTRHRRHTTILIAHRLSTVLHADKILVMEQGRIIQEGRHEELKEVEGRYRNLWKLQGAVEEEFQRDFNALQLEEV